MGLENVTSIFVTNLVNVGKKLETKLQYFDIYLHNKNILEYALLLVHSGRFMIFHIEGSSIIYGATLPWTFFLYISLKMFVAFLLENIKLCLQYARLQRKIT